MEERKKRRVPFQKDVVINGAVIGYALDISEAGMYIHTLADFVSGAVLDLDFDITGKPICVKAAILHIEPGIGIGVKFLNLNSMPDSLMLIKELTRSKTEIRVEKPTKRVLIVDGDSHSRSIYKNRLMQDGFKVFEASNGLEAFRAIQEIRPDIMILDPYIEKVDGFKLLQLLKFNPNLGRIPAIIVSARINPEDVDKAITLGAKDYLVKSTTTPLKLTETVKRLLKV